MSEAFSNDSILDPSLSRVPEAFPSTQVLKTQRQASKLDSDTSGKVTRGPNWGDADSVLLIQAVRFVAENPVCTTLSGGYSKL